MVDKALLFYESTKGFNNLNKQPRICLDKEFNCELKKDGENKRV